MVGKGEGVRLICAGKSESTDGCEGRKVKSKELSSERSIQRFIGVENFIWWNELLIVRSIWIF